MIGKKPLLLTLFLFLVFCHFPLPAVLPNSNYVFRDESGSEIFFPSKRPVISMDQPGIMEKIAPAHRLEITSKTRKVGLEKIRILSITSPQGFSKSQTDKLLAIYVLDKDGLVIGYKKARSGKTAKVTLNGVLNHVKVFLECKNHGLWQKNLYFEFD